MTITVGDVQAAVAAMAAVLDGVNWSDLVRFTPQDGAHPYIEVHDTTFHWVVVERGQELERRTTASLDELLYWAALDTTRSIATRWELAHRARYPFARDTRIGWLAKQTDLLRRLNTDWAEQFRAGIPAQCPGVRLEDVDAHPVT